MRTRTITGGQLKINESYVAEPLEIQLARAMSAEEPIKMGSPNIYTEEIDGVQAAHDIRSDRFEIAQEATNKMEMSRRAKTQNNPAKTEEKGSTQTTSSTEN